MKTSPSNPSLRSSSPDYKSLEIEKIQQEARQRAKKEPLIKKLKKIATGRSKEVYREIVIDVAPLETRVAVLADGVLEKFEVERTGEQSMVGAIFKGKIQNLEDGLQAAFVDIGEAKNAFLHYWDITPAAQKDQSIEIVHNTSTKKPEKKLKTKDVPKQFPVGSEIVVQITKTQIGTKGPRIRANLSFPGRFLVLTPYNSECGISRKIEDGKERTRLKRILQKIDIPEGVGVIIRTAGEGKKDQHFASDLDLLLRKWDQVRRNIEQNSAPAMVHREPDILERTVRDFLTDEIDRILIDDSEKYKEILEAVETISPQARKKIIQFDEAIPIFERFNIERQIDQTFDRNVPLPGGGEILIEETEALVAIDVNTGSHKPPEKSDKGYLLQVNLEAAKEVAKQIRLRNMGGLIIVDFIDMKSRRDRQQLFEYMKEEMAKDRAKSYILPISALGIMQMTRQRHAESHTRGIYDKCVYCSGRGVVKSARNMSVKIQRQLVNTVGRLRHSKDFEGQKIKLRTLLHPDNLDCISRDHKDSLAEIEKAYNAHLSFISEPSFHIERFNIFNDATGEKIY